MKVNLLIGHPAGFRNGYINIDPVKCDNPEMVLGETHKLTEHIDANECEEIVANGVLDLYSADAVDEVLDHWLSRLAHGGTLTISIVDFKEVARSYLGGAIDLEKVNHLIHGETGGAKRCCSLTLSQLVAVLEGKGNQVLSKRMVDFHAVVTCRRP